MDQEHALDFAVAPVISVINRSFGSFSTDSSVTEESDKSTSMRNLERETGFEPATLSLGSKYGIVALVQIVVPATYDWVRPDATGSTEHPTRQTRGTRCLEDPSDCEE